MNVAEIITPWIGVGGGDDPKRPRLADDYVLRRSTDVTHQPGENIVPTPNLYVVRAEMSDATLADIEADATYEVLWSEPIL